MYVSLRENRAYIIQRWSSVHDFQAWLYDTLWWHLRHYYQLRTNGSMRAVTTGDRYVYVGWCMDKGENAGAWLPSINPHIQLPWLTRHSIILGLYMNTRSCLTYTRGRHSIRPIRFWTWSGTSVWELPHPLLQEVKLVFIHGRVWYRDTGRNEFLQTLFVYHAGQYMCARMRVIRCWLSK